jgi:hypothetical protein
VQVLVCTASRADFWAPPVISLLFKRNAVINSQPNLALLILNVRSYLSKS